MKNQHLTRLKAIFTSFLMLFITAEVTAMPVDFKRLEAAVTRFIQQQNVPLRNISVTLTSLNKKLNLKPCNQSLDVNIAPGARLVGHTSLSVSCPTNNQWRIHVAAHIDGFVDVLVAKHPITRKSIIMDSHLEVKTRRLSQLNYGYYSSRQQLRQMIAKRNIKSGQVITPGLLKAKKLVVRGQAVTILAQYGNLNLTAKGKALMDGQKGQTIKVKNLKSKKLIFAQVIRNGVVKVHY